MITFNQANEVWKLSEFGSGVEQRRSIKLLLPQCVVGRDSSADVCIPVSSVSKRHARFFLEHDGLKLEDLGSTNGTYVNGSPIQMATLKEGDLVQFANAIYRMDRSLEPVAEGTMEEGLIPWAQTLLMFERLLSERAVVPHFQPIITMDRKSMPGFEILARSNLPELKNPAAMFSVANRLGQNAALSELMRRESSLLVRSTNRLSHDVFMNTHPDEFGTERLANSLQSLRDEFPELKFTIEVHEGAVTEISQMREFRSLLNDLDMRLSYDDFGAGQGRLLELVEVPPDVLKFDMQLIRDIDSASTNRQQLLRSLVQVAKNSGSTPLAEGVETEAEHAVCVELGFELGQGYLYGRPQPLISQ